MQYGFGSGSIWAALTQFTDGSAPANTTIVKVGVLQEWSMDISWDLKELYGGYDSPLVVARGKAKYPLKLKMAEFNANFLQAMIFGQLSQPATGETIMAEDESHPIPTTPFTVTVVPPNSGVFVADWGVRFATGGPAGGLTLTKVASAPTTGQYSVAGAVYTFAAADVAKGVLISYEYTVTTGYSITLARQVLGNLPIFKFFGQINGGGLKFTVKMNNVVAGKLSLATKLDDFAMSDLDAEAFADNSGNVMLLSMVEI